MILVRPQPKVIFLDAVGTLFGVRGSVGRVYADVAQQFGVSVAPETIDRAFYQSFRAAGTPAFPGITDPTEIQAKEFSWWMVIARNTFQQAGVFEQFRDFSGFFSALYSHFATADPWVLYPDVLPALKHWRSQEIALGIVSNFDSRLYTVLDALDLSYFFSSVTISTEVGAAKPDLQVFQTALKKHGCQPKSAWHIGDRYDEDYQAAHAAGIWGIWLRRSS